MDHLYTGYYALKTVYAALTSNGQAVSDLRGQISLVMGMEGVCNDLDALANSMDAQAKQCQRLFQSIDIICQTYASCENRILDRYENVMIHYEQSPAKFVDLTSAASILSEFLFHVDGDDLSWQQDVLK